MSPLSDDTVRHLQRVLREPEVPGDRYETLDAVGQGGMGTVYRAHDRVLGREVALKVLRADLADAETAGRLEREARILARLEHPGIVPVHDAGTLADGRAFYVMKLVRGARLEDAVRDLPAAEVLRLFLRVCEAVGFAHARGVVHRDLKPSNIMVGSFGEVLVLDWGIARVLREDPEEAREVPPQGSRAGEDRGERDTAPGTVLGTPGFMAPEQAQGWLHLVDARTDVYALGAILRHLAEHARDGEPPPRPLASVWARATAPDPEDRYPTAAALAADVTRFLDGEPVEAHREGPLERAGRVFRKYQTAIVLVLTYLVIRFLFLAARGL
ncbi:MAG TPA: serine/threonine-protein kinase [Gemmatimonadales bacterium]